MKYTWVTVPSPLHVQIHLILTTELRGRRYDYLHYFDFKHFYIFITKTKSFLLNNYINNSAMSKHSFIPLSNTRQREQAVCTVVRVR